MSRDQAYLILTKHLHNKNLLKHSLAAEAAMKALCRKLNPDADKPTVEQWGITGLLHDVDYELAQKEGDLTKHGLLIFEIEKGFPEDIQYAIQAHNPMTGIEPKSQLDWAIRSSDQLTGLIVAATLVLPDKKLNSLSAESVLKRMREPAFAKGVDRTQIKYCEEKLNIPLPEFVQIVLPSMQHIHEDLGL